MTAAAPSGVVTFLFTDVEGSTRRWEADADAMRAALAAHDEVLRQVIEAQGGFVFKHTGDGVCAAFASPRAAVDAAVAAQTELQLPVRMGLATGEAELREGDYFGAVLNRAARVMAAGHGGQILLADSTASLLSGVDLVDLGPRRLRDLPTPVGVFQVCAPGLRTEFPPLQALDASPGNLRTPVTSFIGRESELDEVQAAVKAHRLVTLTGVGGVITQQPDKTVSESVAAALEGRARLLVFDNAEHVRDAAADLIEAILARSSTVRILATSREGLGVADEQLWPVPSLDVGAGIDSAAVDLFVERARSVVPDFSLANPDEAVAVVEICRRLDGIPLAIELAASRMASMTASEVRDRLHQRFRLLVGSRRGVARHQTLRNAVAWSYDHLDNAERALLQRCSVFAGGFDLQSACAVGGSDDVDDYAILDLLDALVRKSLLVADRSAGRTQFSMLETIRQFAEEQLVASGAATEARNAHARHFARRETDILALWNSPHQREAYTWFSAELANLRTAFKWAADHGDLDVAATIATYAAFLGLRVEIYEPITWAEQLIKPARSVNHPRLAALYVMASQCHTTGRIEDAVGYSDAALTVKGSGRDEVPDGIQSWLSAAYLYIGQPDRYVELCRARLSSDRENDAVIQAYLVLALTVAGVGDEAMAAAIGMIDTAEATDDPWTLSWALFAYGFAFRHVEPGRALQAVRRGLVIAQQSGNRANESHLAICLSALEAQHGDPLAAFDYLMLAIRNFQDSGHAANMRVALAMLTVLFDRLARCEAAATIAGFAFSPLTAAFPEFGTAITHLREVLGEATYESLARKGETMTTAAIAAYAYDQIDEARTELNAVSK